MADWVPLLMAGEPVSRRFRINNHAWIPPFEKNWLFVRGGDEFGNTVFAVRISPTRYLDVTLNPRIRTFPLPHGMSLHRAPNLSVTIDYTHDDVPTSRTEKVGDSVLANYDEHGNLASIVLLHLGALLEPGQVEALSRIMPGYALNETLEMASELTVPVTIAVSEPTPEDLEWLAQVRMPSQDELDAARPWPDRRVED